MDASKLKEEILCEIMDAMDERMAKKLADKKGPKLASLGKESEDETSAKPSVAIEIASPPSMEEEDDGEMYASEGEEEEGDEKKAEYSLPERLKRLMVAKK